jgi:hypothetical protein
MIVGCHTRRYTTRDATQFRDACGPLTPRHKRKARCAAMMNTPYIINLGTRPGRRCWTAVRDRPDDLPTINRRSGPCRAPPKLGYTIHGPAAPDHGAAKYASVGRTSTLTQRSSQSGVRLRVALANAKSVASPTGRAESAGASARQGGPAYPPAHLFPPSTPTGPSPPRRRRRIASGSPPRRQH